MLAKVSCYTTEVKNNRQPSAIFRTFQLYDQVLTYLAMMAAQKHHLTRANGLPFFDQLTCHVLDTNYTSVSINMHV